VGDFEVKVSKVEKPMSLSSIEVMRFAEVGEVFMVSEDLNRERGASEVLLPGLESSDDSKEFLIIDIIVSFSRDEGLGEIRTGVPVTIRISLEEDCTSGILRGISGDGKRGREVREVEDGFGEEGLF
jgi:hypothetical protein